MNNPNPFADPSCTNPYAAGPNPPGTIGPSNVPGRGLVDHVRLVSIMQILMGILELVMVIFLIGYGVFLPQVLNAANKANHSEPLPDSAALVLPSD